MHASLHFVIVTVSFIFAQTRTCDKTCFSNGASRRSTEKGRKRGEITRKEREMIALLARCGGASLNYAAVSGESRMEETEEGNEEGRKR